MKKNKLKNEELSKRRMHICYFSVRGEINDIKEFKKNVTAGNGQFLLLDIIFPEIKNDGEYFILSKKDPRPIAFLCHKSVELICYKFDKMPSSPEKWMHIASVKFPKLIFSFSHSVTVINFRGFRFENGINIPLEK